ncbi:MAG TPA: DUF4846 domain-containing protein [Clostridiaceae bacterium]|nr:DUF4846 domain-containing protein [Clostridiaceae bacterium]
MRRIIVILSFILVVLVFLSSCSINNYTGSDSGIRSGEQNGETENIQTNSGKSLNDISNSSENNTVIKNIVEQQSKTSLINEEGITVQERIMVPEGYKRVDVEKGSFGEYLRNLPLKPHGSKVKYYDGSIKSKDVHVAVLDIDVGDRDLQQCADAVMRLWAEYLFSRGEYDRIHFNFTNGFRADYSTWMKGNRIRVEGNNAYWVKQGEYSEEYKVFRDYMDMVFAYAGTLSLSQEMKKIPLEEMQPGDVFLKGELPGHCVIILDMAEHEETKEKIFIIAQSYMPAQDIHILKNYDNPEDNPWYPVNFGDVLNTPEWNFTRDQLFRFDS